MERLAARYLAGLRAVRMVNPQAAPVSVQRGRVENRLSAT
jgi:hypothetical protein